MAVPSFRGVDGSCCDSDLVAIAIIAVDGLAMPMADSLHAPMRCTDIKGARGTYQHSPDMDARILALGHLCSYHPRDAQRDDGKRAIKSLFFEQGKGRETG